MLKFLSRCRLFCTWYLNDDGRWSNHASDHGHGHAKMMQWVSNSIWAFKSSDITRYVNCCADNTRVSWCQSHIAIKCAKFSQIYICSRASEGQLTKLSNIQVAYRRSNGSAASRSSRNQPKYHRLRLKGALSLDFTYRCIIIYHGTL